MRTWNLTCSRAPGALDAAVKRSVVFWFELLETKWTFGIPWVNILCCRRQNVAATAMITKLNSGSISSSSEGVKFTLGPSQSLLSYPREVEFCLGLQLRSLAGQCLDRDWWSRATLLTWNTTPPWGLMSALGSSDSLSTISWNTCLLEMDWIHNTYERPYLVFIHLFNWKGNCFKGFIRKWRNVSREWEADRKLIFVVKVTHDDSLSKVTVSLEGNAATSCESDLPAVFSH